jgi:RNA polymerase sigma-70 factor (ECF subfamily)
MNLGSIKSQAHLSLWLRRATVRLCIDEYRKFTKHFATLESALEPISSHEVGDFLAHGRIRELMSKLPKLSRMVLVLRFQEDLGPSEIAEIMQESVNTVKSRLKRALAALKEKLAPHFVGIDKGPDVIGREE